MLQLVYLKKKKNRHFITPQHFLLFLCGLIWSLLFKTEVEQMNPSVLTFSCQHCFSVRWNKLPSPFIFYNQLRAAESTHSPVHRPCQHLILCGTGSLVSLLLLSLLSSPAQLRCNPFSVKKLLGSNILNKGVSDTEFPTHPATQSW